MNLPDTAAWREALAQVPGAESIGECDVRALPGGTINATFRVRTRQGDFVVRLHEPHSAALGVDRRREVVLQAAAADAGLAPRVLAADPLGRYLVSEFLDGAVWRAADMDDESRLAALAQTLRQLQAVPAPAVPALDLGVLLAAHVAQIAALVPDEARELATPLARARRILAAQAQAARPACIVHGDLTHTNMIDLQRPRLIDWEYATVGDPLMDLACLLAYYPKIAPRGTALLRQCGLGGARVLRRCRT